MLFSISAPIFYTEILVSCPSTVGLRTGFRGRLIDPSKIMPGTLPRVALKQC
jgi:hypothetical protein